MNPFKRKKKTEDIDDGLIIETRDSAQKSNIKPKSSYVLTPDEIEGNDNVYKEKINIDPLKDLKERMQTNFQQTQTEESEEETFTPSFKINLENVEVDFFTESIATEQTETDSEQLQLSFIEGITGPYPNQEEPDINPEAQINYEPEQISLFQTCMPFITEGTDGELPKAEPLYTLERVESILGLEIPEEPEIQKPQTTNDETLVFEAVKTHSADISDIDSSPITLPKDETAEISFTKTMPVIVTPDGLEESREIDISSEIFSKKYDTKQLSDIIEADEDADFTPKFEYESKQDVKKVRRHLLKERRNRFVSLFISVLALIPVLILSLPHFKDTMQTLSVGINVFCTISFSLCVIASLNCFKSIKSLFSNRTESDVLFCFTLVCQFFGILIALINNLQSSVCYFLALLTAMNTFCRSFFGFKRANDILNNFRLINYPHEKRGMMLIDDVPTTFAMAHRAIDGDALIAAPQKASFIKNFMKNSTVDRDMLSKVRIVFIFSAVICMLCGLAVGTYHQSFISGAISFANISAIFCPLITFGVNTLPLNSAAKRLERYKAAIFGVKAASKIEEANAIAIDCDTLFPKGSVKLNSLKILQENDMQETIAIAAAITQTIGSPLYPIFKAAMDTNDSLNFPEADTIKYEDRLGITGWVGNSRVFIGNRALMLAHEIEVPDMQIDKEILKNGYFPVYLAKDKKACALFSVKYVPDVTITKELKRVTNMGITVLINNCDQNLSEEMISDYFDIYSDSVKIMSGSGVHMYKNATAETEELDCGAVFTNKASAMCGIMGCCVKIKRAVTLLTVACIASAVVGVILFAYKYFGTAELFISGGDLVLYQLISLAVTLVSYFFTKP